MPLLDANNGFLRTGILPAAEGDHGGGWEGAPYQEPQTPLLPQRVAKLGRERGNKTVRQQQLNAYACNPALAQVALACVLGSST